MIWKTILLTFLAVGVLAEYQVMDERREQLKNIVIKDMCKTNGAEDQTDAVVTAIMNYIECMRGRFNMNTIYEEIDEAKTNGALNEVIKKYCAKTSELKTCLHSLVTGTTPCLDATIREHAKAANNQTVELIDFVCHKDGESIALFIADGGLECLQKKNKEIRHCGQNAMNGTSPDDIKNLSEDQMSSKFDELSACIVKALEGCNTPTPRNMAESLFRFLHKSISSLIFFNNLSSSIARSVRNHAYLDMVSQ